ncbi:MAG: trypsin-like peptidase domain-containing protein [Planctomycetota bacterium]|nr:trypsin-like peptidase domain-containing protein [Planctomycetota bacterium]
MWWFSAGRGRDPTSLLVREPRAFLPRPGATTGTVQVVFQSGNPTEKSLPAEIVAMSEDPDLAILKVGGIPDDVAPLDVEKNVELVETTSVFVVGFPFGESLAIGSGNPAVTIGKGTISSLRRNETGRIVRVQIDGSLNPGNSGGPIINAKGELLGIAVEAIRGSNIGLAIPTAELKSVLSGNVGKPTVMVYQENADTPPRVQVELPVMDPLGKLREVSIQYVEGLVSTEIGGPVKSIVSDGVGGVTKVQVEGVVGRADLPIELPKSTETRQVTVQPKLVDPDGNVVLLPPTVLAISGANAVRPTRPSATGTTRNSRTRSRSPATKPSAEGFPTAPATDEPASPPAVKTPAEKPTKGGFPAFPPPSKPSQPGPK